MLNESASGPFSDLWSLGVIIYEFMTGTSPWRGSSQAERYDNIKEGNVVYPRTMDKNGANLIQKLIVLNPLERLGIGEPGTDLDFHSLKNHPFFKGIDWE